MKAKHIISGVAMLVLMALTDNVVITAEKKNVTITISPGTGRSGIIRTGFFVPFIPGNHYFNNWENPVLKFITSNDVTPIIPNPVRD